MSLREALNEARQPVKPKFEQWILTLDKDDQAALSEAAADEGLTNAAIIGIVKAAGCPVGKDTIGFWRKQHGYRRG